MASKIEVLCVDDEPMIVEGLQLHLRRRYVVHTATSGHEGLMVLHNNPNIAVIISDMRMPEMDGAKFLAAAREAAPNAVRMLLTGYADMQSAIAAVNEGQIFRFISKPCPPDQLLAAFDSAVAQHQLIVAEKVLLQQTLLGCVDSMAKVLSLLKPTAFGRALRLRNKAKAILRELQWEDHWQTEAAAVLSQLGSVTLPDEILVKVYEGDALDDETRAEVAESIGVSMSLLEHIPRLEPVLNILDYLKEATETNSAPIRDAPVGGLLLKILIDCDSLEAQGMTAQQAVQKMRANMGAYDKAMLETVGNMLYDAESPTERQSTRWRDLRAGMVLAEDLCRQNGVVIVPRGFEIDRGLLEHIRAFEQELASTEVQVLTAAA